jgi:class 3 adenylate cyclase
LAEERGIAQEDLGATDHDPALLEAYARINRNTASPDVAQGFARIEWETDIRPVLPSVHVPAALMVGSNDKLEEARYVASLMPNATLHEVDGRAGSAVEPFLDMLREVAGVARALPSVETVLSTVLFTDIVDSTATQASLGNRGWKDLIERHHGIVRGALERWHGIENDTAGDGFYATFDGPARAIHCAQEVTELVRALGIQIRAGVHTGECELIDGKVGGLPVTIGARVMAMAGPSELLVSQTVKDLVAGSGLTFEGAGEHQLKGLPERWRLYRVAR